MPINLKKYPPDWKKISLRKREKANWNCEFCGAKNNFPHPITGSNVVLTVAHLGTPKPDGTPVSKSDLYDVRDENLAALCQRCHLNLDRDEHIANSKKTRAMKLKAMHDEAGQQELDLGPECDERSTKVVE